MTRRSKLALVTLLTGLLSLASVGTVSASAPCTGYAQEHCEQLAAQEDALRFSAAVAPPPVHILSERGIGQEHFEAMSVVDTRLFALAAPRPVAPHLPGYAPEHYEEIMSK